MCGRPSVTLLMRSQARPCAVRKSCGAARWRPASSRARPGPAPPAARAACPDRAPRRTPCRSRRRLDAAGFLRARQRRAEVAAHAHHLAGRAHFRAEDRVDALELGEREDRFLDRVVVRHDLLRSRPARPASGRPCSARRSWPAACRWPWTRTARCARRAGSLRAGRWCRCRLVEGDRELGVHQADHLQRLGQRHHLLAQLVLDLPATASTAAASRRNRPNARRPPRCAPSCRRSARCRPCRR